MSIDSLRYLAERSLLEGIQAVKSSGRANIFVPRLAANDKRITAIMVENYGYCEEAEKLQNMSPWKTRGSATNSIPLFIGERFSKLFGQ